ncbi:hypothetical protein KAS24_05210 [Candidatus Bathyarchaeota archaeon]|nr:hypothetical protein [Candidatus Bathyarchaeota archaeon]
MFDNSLQMLLLFQFFLWLKECRRWNDSNFPSLRGMLTKTGDGKLRLFVELETFSVMV